MAMLCLSWRFACSCRKRATPRWGAWVDRVRTVSLGYRAPQCLTEDHACRHKNRRVHFRAAQAMPDTRRETVSRTG